MSVRILSYRSLKVKVRTLTETPSCAFAPAFFVDWELPLLQAPTINASTAMDAAHPRNRRLVMLSSSHARCASRADFADGAGIHRCLAATLGRQAPSSGGLTVGQQTSNV